MTVAKHYNLSCCQSTVPSFWNSKVCGTDKTTHFTSCLKKCNY